MTTLITGGTGFVGLALAEHLCDRGEPVVLFGGAVAASLRDRVARLPQCEIVSGDIRNAKTVDALLASRPFDRIVHAAAVTAAGDRERLDASGVVSVNIGGSVSFLEAVARWGAQSGKRPRMISLSSVAAYGEGDRGPKDGLDEYETQPTPLTLYGITKWTSELLLRRLAVVHGLDLAVARVGPVYGPWEHPTGLRDLMSPPYQVLIAALEGAPIVLPNHAGGDFVYARDVVDGIARLAFADDIGAAPDGGVPVYNVGSGIRTSLSQWCEALQSHLPDMQWRVSDGPEAVPTIACPMPAQRPAMRIDALQRITAYAPQFDMGAAATDYLAWIRKA
ncbi:NAD(P)-dependent oxidoreductase [Robbsia sp. KACC 23696]|uniref:NAD-dependent epimerase/dehydratase family protein n=1 Tax=Robbsia sp. KACC 23696 TaxID=3149231 RepID=UPI00325ABCB1